MKKSILPSLLLALLLGGCVVHTGGAAARDDTGSAQRDYDYRLQKARTYTPEGWPQPLQADVYVPEAPGPMPGVLLIHGGGWYSGKREHMNGLARRIAERGYVVVNVSYRFAPQYRYPAQVHDVREALHWMRAHASELQLDPQRVAAWGYSAGGHLASMLGASDARPSDRVQAVVAGGMPADLRPYGDNKMARDFLGTEAAADPQRWAEASPITHVGKNSAPTFLYHGGGDSLVKEVNAEEMKTALDAAGVDAELYRVRGLGHFSMFVFDGGARDAALDFLDRVLR